MTVILVLVNVSVGNPEIENMCEHELLSSSSTDAEQMNRSSNSCSPNRRDPKWQSERAADNFTATNFYWQIKQTNYPHFHCVCLIVCAVVVDCFAATCVSGVKSTI